ncbi:MAG TPA: IS1634 family transposase [Firmicutes bacterium]|nr:IS1634 family transposase [Bacillota bacterium]
MFIKRTKAKSGDKTYTYIQLVESVWRDGRPTHRVVANLGREDLLDPQKVDRLIASLAPYGRAQVARAEDVEILGAKEYGTVYVLSHLWSRLGLDVLFRDLAARRRLGFDVEAGVRAIVFSRIVDPCSERATIRWLDRVYAPDLEALQLHQLYRTLDFVYEVLKDVQVGLLERVTARLVSDLRLVLFDTTSVYFEGDGPSGLARFGYSRDKRSDRPQVVLGLFVTPEGYPLFHVVLPGNTSDIRVFRQAMDELCSRLPVGEIIVVVDRGMVSEANLAALRSAGIGYIAGIRMRHLTTREVLSRPGRYHVVDRNLQVKEVHMGGDERYVVCYNPEEELRDREEREAMVAYLRAQLPKVELNESRIREDACYDGKWVLTTNTALPPAELALSYKGLWKVEDAFRTIKNPLEARPIYHWKDERVLAHLSLCVLAYLLERVIDVAFEKADLGITAQTAIEELSQIRVCELAIGQGRWITTTTLTDRQRAILNALGVPAPERIRASEVIVAK